VQLVLIAIGQLLATAPACDWHIRGVHVFNVNAQVSLPTASRRAVVALKDGLVDHAVDELVGL